jgi:hypothetical protein
MPSIFPVVHADRLRALAQAKGANLQDILFEQSMEAWCARHGLVERDTRCAKALPLIDSDKWLIVFSAEITPEMQSAVRSAPLFRGYLTESEQLSEPDTFLTHLFLHEIAHTLFPNATEQECDDWAFEHLAKHAA